MRWRVAMLVLGLSLLPAAPADAGKRRRCTTHGAEVVLQDAKARVFRVHRGGANWYYGCRLHGRPRLFADDAEDGIVVFGLAYPFVVYGSFPEASSGLVSKDLWLYNLRTREERLAADFQELNGVGPTFEDPMLTRRGTLVWIRRDYDGPGRRSVVMFHGHEQTVLDAGPAVDTGSLALTASGRRAYWMNAGEPRSAALP